MQSTTLQSVSDDSEDSYQENKFPVQNCVSNKINSNIGGYIETLPAGYKQHPNANYPLLIYLHGTASRGKGSMPELEELRTHALAKMIDKHEFPANFTVNEKSFHFIVIIPQINDWPYSNDINDLVNYCIKKYRINKRRIYVCGGSMGGGGTWDYAIDYGKRLAAIVPMAGASWPTTEKGQKIANSGVCVWAFHNKNDPSVPSWYSINYVDYINSYSPRVRAKLTLFKSNEHNCWNTAIDPGYKENGLNIYEWMLHHRNSNNIE